MRIPADPADLRARSATLQRRAAEPSPPTPFIDDDDLLWVGSTWVLGHRRPGAGGAPPPRAPRPGGALRVGRRRLRARPAAAATRLGAHAADPPRQPRATGRARAGDGSAPRGAPDDERRTAASGAERPRGPTSRRENRRRRAVTPHADHPRQPIDLVRAELGAVPVGDLEAVDDEPVMCGRPWRTAPRSSRRRTPSQACSRPGRSVHRTSHTECHGDATVSTVTSASATRRRLPSADRAAAAMAAAMASAIRARPEGDVERVEHGAVGPGGEHGVVDHETGGRPAPW